MSLPQPNPTTSVTLLGRMRDGSPAAQQAAKGEFAAKYALFIVRQIRRAAPSLSEMDLEDVSQNILLAVCNGLIEKSYSADRHNFRKWFATVIRNQARRLLEQHRYAWRGHGDQGLSGIAARDFSEEELERELRQYVIERGMEAVRPEFQESTWRAFVATAVDARSTSDVAAELGITPNAVYLARKHVFDRLRQYVDEVL